MKKLQIIVIILIMILGSIIINNYYKNKVPLTLKIDFSNQIKAFKMDKINKKDDNIGYIKIDKINLKNKLYGINNKKNNVDQNVTILKDSTFPNKKDSTMVIAAHSGTGKVAYFDKINKLEKGDLVTLKLYKHKYIYVVQNKWEVVKTGSIFFPIIEQKQLILTTCSPNKENYQLIINCIIKE